MDIDEEGIDVYNTMLNAMGSKKLLGPIDREPRYVSSILAQLVDSNRLYS